MSCQAENSPKYFPNFIEAILCEHQLSSIRDEGDGNMVKHVSGGSYNRLCWVGPAQRSICSEPYALV